MDIVRWEFDLDRQISTRFEALGNDGENEEEDAYERTKRQLGVLFAPKTRPVFERNVFHSMNMKDKDEDVVEFVSRLKKQAQRCQFGEREGENMIRDVVIAKSNAPILHCRCVCWKQKT